MKIIDAICGVIDKVNDILGKVFSLLVLGILGVILCEVVLRRIFNSPQIWTQDLIVMLFASSNQFLYVAAHLDSVLFEARGTEGTFKRLQALV